MCGVPPQEVPLCGTGRHGFAVQNVPHIFFLCLSKRKRAGHGTKEKALRDELPGGAVNSPKTRG